MHCQTDRASYIAPRRGQVQSKSVRAPVRARVLVAMVGLELWIAITLHCC